MPHDVFGACPLDCPDACSWVVTVDDHGRAVKLRGNADHPHTRGGLCVKVNPYLEFSSDPSRLLHPMRRTGPKGSGQFEPITWDEALGAIAERLHDILAEHGGDSIWPFDGTGSVGYLQGCGAPHRFWSAIGAARHHTSICSISGHLGMSYTSGSAAGMDPEDVVHSKLIVLWGSNTLTSNQHLWPFIETARADGAYVVVIDPVRHRTAERADEHIAPRVGTDAALALGLCHVIAQQGTDTRFLAERTSGWAAFEDSLADYTPERVAQICDVPAEAIIALGTRMAVSQPMAIKLGQGMQRHRHGGQTARVISCIPALTGDYARRGGGLVYSTSDAYMLNGYKLSRPDLRRTQPQTLVMTRLGRELQRADANVKALFVMGANPMVSNPDQTLVRAQLTRDDVFTVVFDAYRTDTAEYADIILPSTLQTEHTEIMESFGHLYLNWNEPAVAPPGECLSKTEFMRRLAAAMGLTEPALFATDLELAADLLDAPLWRDAGIGVDQLRTAGWLRIPGTIDYAPFAERFATPSGRFEFVSARAERDGHGLLPNYRPPSEAADDEPGTFALVSPAGQFFVNSVFAGIDRNIERAGEPSITVCAADAAEQSLVHGELVSVGNDRGSFVARLNIGTAARSGIAVTTKGAWTKVFSDGQSVNVTVPERDSDMGAGAVYHDNRVSIRPYQPRN
ncbi:MAG: molybdopterin-dependent oxidoreductase [Actinobacteria bacterium]|nr:molybdopterin-dependent oxidoreductase [Actinomycetota bacterium]